jgi:hypothetical protein
MHYTGELLDSYSQINNEFFYKTEVFFTYRASPLQKHELLGIFSNSYLPIYDVTLELAPIVFQQFCFLL